MLASVVHIQWELLLYCYISGLICKAREEVRLTKLIQYIILNNRVHSMNDFPWRAIATVRLWKQTTYSLFLNEASAVSLVHANLDSWRSTACTVSLPLVWQHSLSQENARCRINQWLAWKQPSVLGHRLRWLLCGHVSMQVHRCVVLMIPHDASSILTSSQMVEVALK